jgi:hypothetical protein
LPRRFDLRQPADFHAVGEQAATFWKDPANLGSFKKWLTVTMLFKLTPVG